MKVLLSDYNEQWPVLFEKERELLIETISNKNVQIEHIGSTSIKGLIAKPVIDIMIGLKNPEDMNDIRKKIISIDYSYIKEYEIIMPDRRFFRKIKNKITTHHIHMVEINNEFWQRHLAFRNYLRVNPEVAEEYGNFKLKLSEREWTDTNEYAEAKSKFIKPVEKEAIEFFLRYKDSNLKVETSI
jgi:GrpB-like predicted nucleotidyltransferase (UPF0157 family)